MFRPIHRPSSGAIYKYNILKYIEKRVKNKKLKLRTVEFKRLMNFDDTRATGCRTLALHNI
jgi:hypothetical protein